MYVLEFCGDRFQSLYINSYIIDVDIGGYVFVAESGRNTDQQYKEIAMVLTVYQHPDVC